jgi:hypothetical protein
MMRQILEADWKILRKLHPVALGRFCQSVLTEIESVSMDQSKSSHQRYLDIYQLVKRRDKLIADTFDDARRSVALFQLTAMRRQGLLFDEEFLQFSQETQAIVELFLGGR